MNTQEVSRQRWNLNLGFHKSLANTITIGEHYNQYNIVSLLNSYSDNFTVQLSTASPYQVH